jgi:hypothetical protein
MSTLIGYYIFLVVLLLAARAVEHIRETRRLERLNQPEPKPAMPAFARIQRPVTGH